jgi:hypothetical protein
MLHVAHVMCMLCRRHEYVVYMQCRLRASLLGLRVNNM